MVVFLMNDAQLLTELLSRRNTRVLSSSGEYNKELLLKCQGFDTAKCIGLKAHGSLEACATFQFQAGDRKIQYRVVYEKEKIDPKSTVLGRALTNGSNKTKKHKKPKKKQRPILIFTGGFESNRSRH